MKQNHSKTCAVLFGGAGFIGTYFARHLLEQELYDKIYLCDLAEPQCPVLLKRLLESKFADAVEFVTCDVRQSITVKTNESVELIANFAAIHREPGHEAYEYYETNINGAENVCHWAESVNCSTIIFSSSIAPYGIGENVRTENTLPVPATAYGGSKLVAEKIHERWLNKDINSRHLVIVRPGVVFGAFEGGNVTRMIKAVLGRYFFYSGNQETRKAGVYVKELCNAMTWVLDHQHEKQEHHTLFNMTMSPAPTIEDYVKGISEVSGKKVRIPSIPYPLLLCAAYIIDLLTKPIKIKQPFSPVRIKKLVRSNNIVPQYLRDNGYPYKYSLLTALQDWRAENPDDWATKP